LFVTQLHRNIDQPIIHLVSGAKYGGIGAAYIAAFAGGATRSLIVGGVAGLKFTDAAKDVGLWLGLPVIFVGAFGGFVYGVGQMIASPWYTTPEQSSYSLSRFVTLEPTVPYIAGRP
jgi:hypothetical protein